MRNTVDGTNRHELAGGRCHRQGLIVFALLCLALLGFGVDIPWTYKIGDHPSAVKSEAQSIPMSSPSVFDTVVSVVGGSQDTSLDSVWFVSESSDFFCVDLTRLGLMFIVY